MITKDELRFLIKMQIRNITVNEVPEDKSLDEIMKLVDRYLSSLPQEDEKVKMSECEHENIEHELFMCSVCIDCNEIIESNV